jgi:hypothetical protein
VSIAILIFFAVLGTLKIIKILTSLRVCSEFYAQAEHTGQELLRALNVYASGTDAHLEDTHQFLMRILSMCISFPHFSNVDFVYPQQPRKEQMRALSMGVRN